MGADIFDVKGIGNFSETFRQILKVVEIALKVF